MRIVIAVLCAVFVAGNTFASTLDGYDRSALADENYRLAHGDEVMPGAVNDPEFAAVLKKYVYADIARQAKLTLTAHLI